MAGQTESPSRALRKKLDHPVIDVDGHMVEFFPVFFDYLKQVGGQDMVDRMWATFTKQNRNWHKIDRDERRRYGVMRPAFWGGPSENTVDRATAMMPRLMHERLPEMGIDYSVVYPTVGFLLPDLPQEDIRKAACRAHNQMTADIFAGTEDRLTPAAVIPCHTPDEAIAELDFTLNELGLKVPMFANLVRRPLDPVAELDPDLGRYAFWVDTLALDSIHDYDPVWQKCVDLKVPVTAHAVAQGIGMRRSISNYMYNQTGHFADAAHAFAKSLFFGGVTHRFPTLNFAFLECGVAWGACLVCDLVERWEKRNKDAVQQFNPERLDRDKFNKLLERYGGDVLTGYKAGGDLVRNRERPDNIDDFAAAGIGTLQDLHDRLVPNFFYGCEADDRMNYTGFNERALPFGAKLNAVFSSDFGHWDVPDMSLILSEAYELVEDEMMTGDDFRDFVFTNPVKLLASMNPNFFKGTAVESEAAKVICDLDAAQAA